MPTQCNKVQATLWQKKTTKQHKNKAASIVACMLNWMLSSSFSMFFLVYVAAALLTKVD
jgi:hypothetical protein